MPDQPPRMREEELRVPPDAPKDTPPPPPPPRRRPAATALQGKLEDFFAGTAIMLSAVGDDHCARVMADRAKALAEAWTRLAQRNDRVRVLLEALTSGGAYGEVVAVTLSAALPIAAHHSSAVRSALLQTPLAAMAPDPPAPPRANGHGPDDPGHGPPGPPA